MRISELSAEISNAERFHSFLRQRRKPARWKKRERDGDGTILVILREFWSSFSEESEDSSSVASWRLPDQTTVDGCSGVDMGEN